MNYFKNVAIKTLELGLDTEFTKAFVHNRTLGFLLNDFFLPMYKRVNASYLCKKIIKTSKVKDFLMGKIKGGMLQHVSEYILHGIRF